ncbi:TadE/TadG family type IV pilus assembly protein [Ancylobacter terrae]|uniref:TadE/TadG family type IV pilus assembly protein n=1 Tax=Ancylobacter sp. sgz301288 TaxID=3342077 RepID=UPI00385AD57D
MTPALSRWTSFTPFTRLPFLRLGRDRRGVAAVEFALIAPVMVLLYLGGTELTRVLSVDRKVSMAARVASDLVARQTNSVMSAAELTTALDGASAMLAPFGTGPLGLVVSSIVIDDKGKATVSWSVSRNGKARTKGTAVTLPAGIAVNSSSLIWAEASYAYPALFDLVIKSGTLDLSESSYMRPRNLSRVCYLVSC